MISNLGGPQLHQEQQWLLFPSQDSIKLLSVASHCMSLNHINPTILKIFNVITEGT